MGAENVIKPQPDPMSVSKPTIMEQIIAARINKQKALEEGRAVKQKVVAPAVKAVGTPRKLVTRRAVEQKEESGGNVSEAQSDQKPRRSTRAQMAADGKGSTNSFNNGISGRGYLIVAIKVNSVDIPLVVKVKSLRAALGPTSVKDVQPVQEQPAEKEKKRAPC